MLHPKYIKGFIHPTTLIAALLPVGEYYELKPEEIENFIPENTPTDGNYWYILNFDY